jgi:hypothetical protein
MPPPIPKSPSELPPSPRPPVLPTPSLFSHRPYNLLLAAGRNPCRIHPRFYVIHAVKALRLVFEPRIGLPVFGLEMVGYPLAVILVRE